jgi:hypothetical protein
VLTPTACTNDWPSLRRDDHIKTLPKKKEHPRKRRRRRAGDEPLGGWCCWLLLLFNSQWMSSFSLRLTDLIPFHFCFMLLQVSQLYIFFRPNSVFFCWSILWSHRLWNQHAPSGFTPMKSTLYLHSIGMKGLNNNSIQFFVFHFCSYYSIQWVRYLMVGSFLSTNRSLGGL